MTTRTDGHRARLLARLALAAVAVGAVAVVPLCTRLQHQDTDLYRKAKLVFSLASNWSPNDSYFWLSANELLLLKCSDYRDFHAYHVKLPAGVQRRLDKAEAVFAARGFSEGPTEVSPDGKWLLCRESDRERYHLFATDDSEHIALAAPRQNHLLAYWLDARDRWVTFTDTAGGAGLVYDVRQGAVGRFDVPKGVDLFLPDGITAGDRILNTDVIDFAVRSHVDLSEYAVGRPSPPRVTRVPLPFPASVVSVVPARSTDRLAWVLCTQPREPGYWLERLLHLITRPEPRRYLWVSDTRGNQFQLVGTFPDYGSKPDIEVANQFVWLPNGRQISFVYRNAIHTVPVR